MCVCVSLTAGTQYTSEIKIFMVRCAAVSNMEGVTYASLVSPRKREGEIDKWLHLSRDVLTVHTLHCVLQLTLKRP